MFSIIYFYYEILLTCSICPIIAISVEEKRERMKKASASDTSFGTQSISPLVVCQNDAKYVRYIYIIRKIKGNNNNKRKRKVKVVGERREETHVEERMETFTRCRKHKKSEKEKRMG